MRQRFLSIFLLYISPFIAALALFLFVGYRRNEPFWTLDERSMLLGFLVSLGFIVGWLMLRTKFLTTQRSLLSIIRTCGVTVLVTQPIFLILLFTDTRISRVMLAYELVLLFALLIVNSISLPGAVKLLINLSLLTIALVPSFSVFLKNSDKPKIAEKVSVDYVLGSYYDLKVTNHVIFNQRTRSSGGGLELVDENRLLLMTGDGTSFIVMVGAEDVQTEPLEIKFPLNTETYFKHNPNPMPQWFRVTDILLEKGNTSESSLYVSNSHWDSENDCYTLRLSEAKVNFNMPIVTNWTKRYESEPCLKLTRLNNVTGGRLAFLKDSSILMTIGDHGEMTPDLEDNLDFSYGKILELNRIDWNAKVFTRGHRNPQGLLVDGDEIWETEHGPRGGDELNLLKYGADYGWPTETYGTDYGKKIFKFNKKTGDHSRKKRPIYAWIPSIAISNLIRISGTAFPAWKGDLMVSSLYGRGNGRSLFRVRIREGRAVVVERLKTGLPIRDFIEMPDGRLVLWNGFSTIQTLEPANHILSSCSGCHALRWQTHGIGPDLMGVVGQKVAFHKGYNYSRAMIQFGGKWSPERLDAFLSNPEGTVPGTTMETEGINDPEKRKAIINYLKKAQQPLT